MIQQQTITIQSHGRATIEITREVESIVRAAALDQGLCHVFVHHTSASLIITENADPDVRRDLETWIAGQVRDGDAAFVHDQEGPDDMPAHIRSVLTQTGISIPIQSGALALGTWQGLFLWEHRLQPQPRKITVTLLGATE